MDSFETARNIDLLEFIRENVTDRIIKKGRYYFVSCPLDENGDSDPSLCIYPDTNSFNCFHCGGDFNGTIIDFVKGWAQLESNYQALEYLDRIYPKLGLLNQKAFDTVRIKNKFIEDLDSEITGFTKALKDYPIYTNALKEKRGIDEQTIDKFRLGLGVFGGFKRLVIPQLDKDGRPLSYVTRTLETNDFRPKYLASNVYLNKKGTLTQKTDDCIVIWEKSKFLYNIHNAKATDLSEVWVVEGQLDVIAANILGLNAVGVGMKVPSSGQAILLAKFNQIVISPDSDAIESVLKTYSIIRTEFPDKPIMIASMPNGFKDFGELVMDKKAFSDIQKVYAEDFIISRFEYRSYYDLLPIMTEPIGRSLAIQKIAEKVGINDPMLLSASISNFIGKER